MRLEGHITKHIGFNELRHETTGRIYEAIVDSNPGPRTIRHEHTTLSVRVYKVFHTTYWCIK